MTPKRPHSTLLLLWVLFSTQLHAETLVIAADDWFPMNGNPQSDFPGYMIEIAKEIFAKKNIDVQYELVPWERALNQTRKGLYNCVVGAYKKDAPDFEFPNLPWGYDNPSFFVPAMDSWTYDGKIESLHSRKIGVIEGYTYTKEFDSYSHNNRGMKIQIATGDHALEINLRKLFAGRIDTLLENEYVVNAKLATKTNRFPLKNAGALSKAIPIYFACSPNLPTSKTYVKWADQQLTKLRKTGRLKAILSRYQLADWQ